MIRRALPRDAAALTRVAHAAKRHWRYPEPWIVRWREGLTLTPGFIERLPVYCAVEGARVVGFYALSGRGAARELEHLWVVPARIGAGLGQQLLEHARATARGDGARFVTIASDPYAVGFYLRMGARRVGNVASMPRGRTLPLLLLSAR
ncbi:MAG: GNAT family N-acetyltransferase [Candidatus Rokuibacteriota bacterium]